MKALNNSSLHPIHRRPDEPLPIESAPPAQPSLQPPLLSRRSALRLAGAGLLSAAGSTFNSPAANRTDGTFTFLAVNDIHYTDASCGVWLENVVRQMKEHLPRPDFCILVGDLSENGTTSQLASVREIFSGLRIPLYPVIGNHDFTDAQDRPAYDRIFPGRLNYHFRHKGWRFLGLDTTEGTRVYRATISSSTLRWLDQTMPTLSRTEPLIVFTRFPLGSNILRPLNAKQVIRRLAGYNLQAVFSGHWHGLTRRRIGTAIATTNRCCSLRRSNHDGFKGKGYFFCEVSPTGVTRNFVEVRGASL